MQTHRQERRIMIFRIQRTACLLLWSLMALPVCVMAESWELVPALSLVGRYDDNLSFATQGEVDDYSSIIKPSFTADYLSEKTQFSGLADVAIINYLEEKDLDTINYNVRVNGDTRATERLKLNADFRFIRDTLLDSELEETGRVFDRTERVRRFAGAGIQYDATTLSSVGLNYDFVNTEYEDSDRQDRDVNSLQGFYRQSFNDGRDYVAIVPGYDFRDSDEVEANNYRLQIGWTRRSTEIGELKILAGGRYTEEQRPGLAKDDGSGFIGELDYQRRGTLMTFRLGYRRDLRYDANDDLVNVDRFFAGFDYKLTERLKFGLDGKLYFTSREFEDDNEQYTRYIDIIPRLVYNLTERHYLQLTYRYSQQYDNARTNDKTANRNQVLLTLAFRFPQQL
jgi:hypothetical protein